MLSRNGPAQQQQQPGNAPENTKRSLTPGSARSLPDTNVTSTTLEDAYVNFIFYCNPAVPGEQNTQTLREAFRNPPKSAGKTFDTFEVFNLVKQFYGKEIKTWTELTIKLGVEPPDPKKDESAQKVTQYGVRLKKWMNSLHIKSFFEYLMEMPNDYWTKIPDDPDPTSQQIRDGVAVEDDMALRALLPHIRPRRGRKRPDESDSLGSAPQRIRLSPSSIGENTGDHQSVPAPDVIRSAHPGLSKNDGSQTPFNQWPASAITPTIRGSFWDDALEPHSAITPTQSKAGRQRRGAKNVSSAWKTGGPDACAKPRGRPPINRTPIEGPGFQFQSWVPSKTGMNRSTSPPSEPDLPTVPEQSPATTSAGPPTASANSGISQQPPATHTPIATTPIRSQGRPQPDQSRPARPSISLQVPERPGAPVRLATPPAPVVMVNGEEDCDRDEDVSVMDAGFSNYPMNNIRNNEHPQGTGEPCSKPGNHVDNYFFERMEDRTNVDSLLEYFMQAAQEAQWMDKDGNPDQPASIAESAAIINSTMQNMLQESTSTKTFLVNLSALAGAKALKAKPVRCTRLADDRDAYNYKFEWEYRFGHLKGDVSMTQAVSRTMWKRPGADASAEGGLSAEEWQRKYQVLLGKMKKRDEELSDLQAKAGTPSRKKT